LEAPVVEEEWFNRRREKGESKIKRAETNKT